MSRFSLGRYKDALPYSFNDELEAYFNHRSRPDAFADGEYVRPLCQSSIMRYRGVIQRFVAQIVSSGTPVAETVNLAALVEPSRVEAGLRRMLAENGNKSSGDIAQTAFVLVGVARAINTDEVQIARLEKMSRKVAVPRQRGMTEKNRSRLRTLQEERRLQALIKLPDRIFARVPGKTLTFAQALERETAVAIMILLYCPIRIQNLAQIHLDSDLQRPGDHRVYLVFREDDVKNARPIEFELPSHVVRMIDKHLATRPISLCPPGTPWLFPRRDGQSYVHKSQLATRIARLIRKETGLEANPHLFRHLAVMMLLEAHPGAYENAKRLLGHSATSHTISVYSGMETQTVSRLFADMIDAKRKKKQ